MALILKVVAAVLTVIGAATLYWGTSPSLLSLGNTVMIVGATVGTGGIVLFGLAAVLGQLQVLGSKLDGLQGLAAGPIPAPMPATLAEPPAAEPLHAGSHAPIAAPLVEPDLRPAPEPILAPAGTMHPEPAAPVPPTRRSFGLPPLATQAPVAAGAAVAGLAAGTLAAAAAPALPADKAADRGTPVPSSAVIEPPVVAPAIVAAQSERENDVEREKDVERAQELFGDVAAMPPEDFRPVHVAPELDHAVEAMKDEVKAAEADLAVPPDEAGDAKDGGDGPVDHLASLERLLLGASVDRARAPAEPESPDAEQIRSEVREPKLTAVEPLEPESTRPGDEHSAQPEPPGLDTDDFMARLRETISRPVAPPAPPPAILPEPPAAAPPMSIEEELERALKASLEAPQQEPAKPVYVEPPKAAEPAPFLRPIPSEPQEAPAPVTAPAVERAPERRDDPMAALARDFPELNDILNPKRPAADPAASLMDDLKDIFEPAVRPAARREPVFPEPAPPPSAPKPPLLREGVIATIPFRLYGDGTIEADLPEGTTQFASLKDFRAHVGG